MRIKRKLAEDDQLTYFARQHSSISIIIFYPLTSKFASLQISPSPTSCRFHTLYTFLSLVKFIPCFASFKLLAHFCILTLNLSHVNTFSVMKSPTLCALVVDIPHAFFVCILNIKSHYASSLSSEKSPTQFVLFSEKSPTQFVFLSEKSPMQFVLFSEKSPTQFVFLSEKSPTQFVLFSSEIPILCGLKRPKTPHTFLPFR